MANKISTYKKRIAIIGLSLILIAVLVVGWLYRYAEQRDFYFEDINALVGAAVGYALHKPAPLELSLWPRPTLTARDLTIFNPAIDPNTPLASVKTVSAALQWWPLLKLDLVLDVETDAARIDLQIDAAGRQNWMNEELMTITGGLPFALDKVDTRATALTFRNQQTAGVLGVEIEEFDLDLAEGRSSARIETAGRFGDSRFYALGDAVYAKDGRRLDLDLDLGAGPARSTATGGRETQSVTDWIAAHAASFPFRGTLNGGVRFEDRIPAGRLDFTAHISSVREFAYLAESLGFVSASLGGVEAKGTVNISSGDLDIAGLGLSIRDDATELVLTGAATDLLSTPRAELMVRWRTDALSAVIDRSGLPVAAPAGSLLDRIHALTAEAKIVAQPGHVIFDRIQAGLSISGLQAEVRGRIEAVPEDIQLDLDFRGESADPAGFLGELDLDAPNLRGLGPASIAAHITGGRQRYKIEKGEITLQGGNVRAGIEGEVTADDDTPRFDLQPRLIVEDAGAFSRPLLPDAPDRALAGFKLNATGKLEGSPENFGFRNFELDLSREGQQLKVQGALVNLPGKPGADSEFRIAWDEPIPLDDYLPNLGPFDLAGPMDITGAVHAANGKIRIAGITISAKGADVDGDIVIDTRVSPPRIYVVAESGEFSARVVRRETNHDQAPPPGAAAGPASPESDEATPPGNTSPSEAYQAFTRAIDIRTDWIRDLDLYLSFSARKAKLHAQDLENVRLLIDARDGVFTLAEYRFEIDQKPIAIAGFIDSNPEPPVYAFRGKIERETLESLLNLEEGLITGGLLSGNFRLVTRGHDLAELIEHLHGEALVTVGPLSIGSSILNTVSSDIFLSMLKGITHKKEDRNTSAYRCGVLGVDVSNGVAVMNKSFAMEADAYNLAGQGRVDLNTGYVDLTVAPKASKGIGLSPSTLVGGFKVEGHMATPNIGLQKGGLLTAAITGYALTPTAALAANPAGATILATGFFAKGVFDRLTASNYSCANTLKRIERNRQRLAGGQTRNPQVPKWREEG